MDLQNTTLEKLLYWFAIAGIAIVLIALILFIGDSFLIVFDFKYVLDTDKFDHFGSFIGGSAGLLFTIATTILVYLTYQTQKAELEQARHEARASREALQMQAKTNQIQQFENTFFNLLTNHREVLNSLQETWTKGETNDDERVFRSREVIDVVVSFIKAVSFKGLHYSREGYPVTVAKRISSTKFADYIPIVGSKYNLAHLIHTFQLKEKHGKGFYLSDFGNPEGLSNIYFEVFIQNRSSLGHYFRNLFHIVKFIDEYKEFESFYSKEISDNEVFKLKYNYIRLVRAQLSNNELILLALNSITEFGEDFIPYIEKYKLLKNTDLIYELGGMEGLAECYPHFLQPE